MLRKIFPVCLIGLFVMSLSSCSGMRQKKVSEQESANAYHELGVQYLNEGNYQRALIELRKAAALRPRDSRLHNGLGLVYYYTGRYEEAEKEYKRAVSLKKNYSEAYVNLGTLYARRKEYAKAIDQFQKALENPFYPTPALSLHNIGICYMRMDKFDEAESALVKAVQQDPHLLRAYFDLGKLYYQNNRMDQAIKILSQAIQRHPKIEGDSINALSLATLHYWLALSYFKNGDSDNAVIHFQEVRRLSSNSKLSEEAWKYLNLLQ